MFLVIWSFLKNRDLNHVEQNARLNITQNTFWNIKMYIRDNLFFFALSWLGESIPDSKRSHVAAFESLSDALTH